MKGYIGNIEQEALSNHYFRRVLYTAKHCQLVVMSIEPKGEIGEEVHHLDQFIRCESGKGKVVLEGKENSLSDGFAVIVPAGMRHNIINISLNEALKLYTIYSPPNHRDRVVHKTKADALVDEEEFDGITTE